MWRKNRSVSEESSCIGVDLNRNFDANWCSEYTIVHFDIFCRGDCCIFCSWDLSLILEKRLFEWHVNSRAALKLVAPHRSGVSNGSKFPFFQLKAPRVTPAQRFTVAPFRSRSQRVAPWPISCAAIRTRCSSTSPSTPTPRCCFSHTPALCRKWRTTVTWWVFCPPLQPSARVVISPRALAHCCNCWLSTAEVATKDKEDYLVGTPL